MSSLDSTNSISTPGVYSGSASPIDYSIALSPWTLSATSAPSEGLVDEDSWTNIRFVTPAIQTFQIGGSGSTIYGYTVDDPDVTSGHFVYATDSLNPEVVRVNFARMACHFLVDLTPATGLEEVLEKTTEIREYYCSLEGWQRPALAAETSVAANPEVRSFVRDPFTVSGE